MSGRASATATYPVAELTEQATVTSTEQNGQLSPLFLLEFRYLPTTLASKATSVTLTEVAGRITVLLPNRALDYPHTFTVSYIITFLL